MRFLKSDVTVFLGKVAIIYVLWYIIYELWLLPEGSLDAWLTSNIVSVSAGMLKMYGYNIYAAGRMMGVGHTAGIYLADGCSGISAIGLFIGFVMAYPGAWIPRMAFICTGIGAIYLINIMRIITLAITQAYWPGIFEITHDYSTTAIFYLIIFGLWMIWANLGGQESAERGHTLKTA